MKTMEGGLARVALRLYFQVSFRYCNPYMIFFHLVPKARVQFRTQEYKIL